MLKCTSKKKFRLLTVMIRNFFACVCIWTISPIYIIFNKKHFTVNLNNIHQFHENLRELEIAQTDKLNALTFFNLESVKNEHIQMPFSDLKTIIIMHGHICNGKIPEQNVILKGNTSYNYFRHFVRYVERNTGVKLV